ncbi:MAG: saccharopine dehydrogenase family protein [Jatrophihabitans sp.]
MPGTREYDIVLVGATGFTGGLVAEHFARRMPPGTRWAIAGRNAAKLAAVRDRLGPGTHDVGLLHADVTEPDSMRAIAESTRVLVTTVGPYLLYGEPLVAACASAGTDYLDLTSEEEFVDTMYLEHHQRAMESGARLVHSCGFDSIPHDLGAYFTVGQLPDGKPVRLAGYVQARGHISSGTYQSVVTAMSRLRAARHATERRRLAEAPADGRRARVVSGRPHRVSELSAWAVPLPTIDPVTVVRSARALPRYGPDFAYSHFAAVKHLTTVVAGAAALGGVIGLAQVPPARRLLLGRMAAGSGPSTEQRSKSWFRIRFVGTGGGARAVTEVSGGDPGYGATAAILAESTLCLAFDHLPDTSGQVTPAVAMGQPLIDRLAGAGISFEVLGVAR